MKVANLRESIEQPLIIPKGREPRALIKASYNYVHGRTCYVKVVNLGESIEQPFIIPKR